MTNTANGRTAREGRQARAAERLEARSQRSNLEQINLLAKRPGKSLREATRLYVQEQPSDTKVSRQKKAKRKAAAA